MTPDECPDRALHTPMASGYGTWGDQAEAWLSYGWWQQRCAGCGLWKIWTGGWSYAVIVTTKKSRRVHRLETPSRNPRVQATACGLFSNTTPTPAAISDDVCKRCYRPSSPNWDDAIPIPGALIDFTGHQVGGIDCINLL